MNAEGKETKEISEISEEIAINQRKRSEETEEESFVSSEKEPEVSVTRALWEEIFPEDTKEFLDYYYSVKTADNRVQMRHTDGMITAMIHWNPYPVRICGNREDSCYLVAVATKKEFRHQGQMAGLLQEGLRRCAAQQIPFVWLMPADPAIYEPFDFRYIYSKSEGEWPPESESGEKCFAVSEPENKSSAESEPEEKNMQDSQQEEKLRIRILHPEEYQEAAAFLNRELAHRYDVYTERTASYLSVTEAETQTEDGHAAAIFFSGAMVGIFSYWIEDTIIIRELVTTPEYESGEERDKLVRAIRSFFAEIPKPITVITTGWMGEKKPIIMARPANLAALMTRIRTDQPQTFRFRISDPIIPENNGCFLWKTGSASAVWQKIPEEVPVDYDFPIAQLTEWLFGIDPGKLSNQRLLKSFFNEIV